MSLRMLACCLVGVLAATAPVRSAAADPAGANAVTADPDALDLSADAAEPPAASLTSCGEGRGTLGVRVLAPYRGGERTPWVRIRVEWYSSKDDAWRPVGAADSGWYQAGDAGTRTSSGWTFPFRAPSEGHRLVMRGVASVQWRGEGGGPPEAQMLTPVCEVRS